MRIHGSSTLLRFSSFLPRKRPSRSPLYGRQCWLSVPPTCHSEHTSITPYFKNLSDVRAKHSLQKRSQSVEWERTRTLASRYFDDALRACRAGRSIPEELASDTFLTAGIALLTVCVSWECRYDGIQGVVLIVWPRSLPAIEDGRKYGDTRSPQLIIEEGVPPFSVWDENPTQRKGHRCFGVSSSISH